MWDITCALDVSTFPSPSYSSLTGPESQNCLEMVSGSSHTLAMSSTPSSSTTPTSNQLTVHAPESGPSAAPQLSAEQLQPHPLINPLCFGAYRRLDAPVALQKPQFHWPVVAGAPHGLALAASDTIASISSPIAVVVHSSDHEFGARLDLTWASSVPTLNPVTPSMFLNYETLNLNAGAGSNLSQSAGVMRPDERYNRVADRHQRLTVCHPYAIPLVRANHTDTPMNCGRAELATQLPPRADDARDLTSSNPDWRLTLSTYEWLFAVLYPKRRPDKKKPTPSGPCQLCDSTCKRPGILQQHLTVLHRQRLARKHLAGKPYDLQLALAFVVAQVLCGVVMNAQIDAVYQESQAFLGILKNNPAGLESLQPGAFPLLHQKLDEFSRLASWVGVQCRKCGMWATRRIALEEHVAVCSGFKRSADSSGLTNISQEPFRLTASGLAARPHRG
jgi:hypothetical protein